MAHSAIFFHHVSFTYDMATKPLLESLAVRFGPWWTGVVGANGVGKTTLLKLATGSLQPTRGHVEIPGETIYCPQRTDEIPERFAELVAATDGQACRTKGQLCIRSDWPERWGTLSHGERKRAQIAVILWTKPLIFAVDEPTNHLDAEARHLLAAALQSFHGIGLLVSHDRELLDTLCRQCLFIDPPEAVLRPGGYSEGAAQARQEALSAQKQYAVASHEQARLKREMARRRELAARANRRRSKRGLAIKDHDTRCKLNLARVTGRDGVGGKLMRQMEGRLDQAVKHRDSIRRTKSQTLGISMDGARAKRDTLFNLSGHSLPLGVDRKLRVPDLVMKPADRIALTGPNGAGKSTLVRHIVRNLNIASERLAYIPQEIGVRRSREILSDARTLPRRLLGRMMTVVSRLGSQPDRLLETDQPSPGEIRKVLLAMGIAKEPYLIIMDEPTNHMDLPSIECLEHALDGCPCGLLLVSHDHCFLDKLTHRRWHITPVCNDQQRSRQRSETFVLAEWGKLVSC